MDIHLAWILRFESAQRTGAAESIIELGSQNLVLLRPTMSNLLTMFRAIVPLVVDELAWIPRLPLLNTSFIHGFFSSDFFFLLQPPHIQCFTD
jgi:hypothetical protein